MDSVTHIVKQFNWRFMLVRLLANAVTLLIIVLLVPQVYFVDRTVLNLFFMALMLGLFNIVFRPFIQFLTLPLLFATFGLIIGLINAVILVLLAWFFPARFAVTSLFWAIVAGVLMGIVSTFLESLLGLTRPIIPEDMPDLAEQLDERDPHLIRHLIEEEMDERRALTDKAEVEPPLPDVDAAAAHPVAASAEVEVQSAAQPVVEPEPLSKSQQEDDHANSNAQ